VRIVVKVGAPGSMPHAQSIKYLLLTGPPGCGVFADQEVQRRADLKVQRSG